MLLKRVYDLMAFALSGNPFSAVLQTLREQSSNCRSLSYRLIKDERHFTQALRSIQLSRPSQMALTAARQQAQEPSISSDFFAAKTTFEELDYDGAVCQAIRRTGLEQPSRVQVRLCQSCTSIKSSISTPLSDTSPFLCVLGLTLLRSYL